MRRRELVLILWRRDDFGAPPSRAAEGDAGDRLPQQLRRPDRATSIVAAFRQGLSETGYVEGQNVAIEYRWAEGHYDRLPALAADLVSRKVDVIVATRGASALQRRKVRPRRSRSSSSAAATRSRPASSPVSRGRAATSRASAFSRRSLTPKRLELLSELVPHAGVIALLVNPTIRTPSSSSYETCRKRRARRGGSSHLEGQHRKRDRRRFRHPRPTARRRTRRRWPIRFSTAGASRSSRWRHAMPFRRSMSGANSPTAGGLISYGPVSPMHYRQVGVYVGRSSRVPILPICRSSSRPGSSWSSISRPPRRLA